MGEKLNTELKVQIALMRWMKEAFPIQAEMLVSIPNGVRSNHIRGNLLNLSGLTKGLPDLFLACPVQIWVDKPDFYHGLWLELKRDEKCYASKAQKETLEKLARRGYVGAVAKGLEEGKFWITTYLMRAETIDNEHFSFTHPRPNSTCYHYRNPRAARNFENQDETTAPQSHDRVGRWGNLQLVR